MLFKTKKHFHPLMSVLIANLLSAYFLHYIFLSLNEALPHGPSLHFAPLLITITTATRPVLPGSIFSGTLRCYCFSSSSGPCPRQFSSEEVLWSTTPRFGFSFDLWYGKYSSLPSNRAMHTNPILTLTLTLTPTLTAHTTLTRMNFSLSHRPSVRISSSLSPRILWRT